MSDVIDLNSRRSIPTSDESPRVVQLQCGSEGCGNRTFTVRVDTDDEGDEYYSMECAACQSVAMEVMVANAELSV